jgi:hypothetical protein
MFHACRAAVVPIGANFGNRRLYVVPTYAAHHEFKPDIFHIHPYFMYLKDKTKQSQ